ncbi:MAG: D-2-hydroxyacid dehydrogenase [Chloroflexi bacterium]|nr:D-2-hydroxyacid dehydrogenase [Chloroflexota bacterium]
MSKERQILITVQFNQEQLDELQSLGPDFKVISHPLAHGQDLPEGVWAQVEILYTFRALPQPEQAPKLRWIQFHLAGVEEHLEQAILRQAKVQATTLSGANAPQVAEHALALMLAIGHHLPEMVADQSRSQWATQRTQRYIPKELINSTVGIIGYGSVGQRLARMLQSFGVTILANKRDLLRAGSADYQVDGQGDPAADLPRRLYPGKALRSLLKECDYVVVTVPLTEETRGMLGAKQLSAMKPNAVLVDVSRGGVVDQEALIHALEKGQLAGAGLDVFAEEPLPADNPLWEMPNVLISPHVAGLSPHYVERAFALFKENLRRYIGGEELLNKIDLERGY